MYKEQTKRKILSLFLSFAVILGIIPLVNNTVNAAGYIITNPYEHVNWSTYKQYKAGFHSHTTNSDGSNTTSSTAERYYDLGYNIVAFTDHNYTTISPNLVGTGAMSRTRINEMANGSGRTGDGMIFVHGANERSGLKYAALDAIGAKPSDPPSHHVLTYWSTIKNSSREEISDMLKRLAAEGTGLAVVAHPGRNTGASRSLTSSATTANGISNNPNIYNKYVDLFRNSPELIGMEIINEFDWETFGDKRLWDNILSQLMPEGRPVWGFSNDDSHRNAHIGYSYNLMLMPELTVGELRHSMQTGAFFAFSRVDRQRGIHPGNLRIEDQNGSASRAETALNLAVPEIRSISVGTDSITISTDSGSTVEWFSGSGNRVATGNTINLANIDITNGYVRAEVFNTSRGILYTQPFGVEATSRPNTTLQSVNGTFEPVTVASGAYANEWGLNLPSGTALTTNHGIRYGAIKWNFSGLSYDRSKNDANQTFNVNGTVILPPGISAGGVSLNVSVHVTVLKDCSTCTTNAYDVWTPNFMGKTVDGANVGGNMGVQIRDTANSTVTCSSSMNQIRISNNTASDSRGFLINTTSGAAGAKLSGWNRTTSFEARAGITYRATFDASISTGTGQGRVRLRENGSSDVRDALDMNDLSTTAKTYSYEWTQTGDENLEFNTRNLGQGVSLNITNLKIQRVISSCVDPYPACYICLKNPCECCKVCGEPDCRCCDICGNFPCVPSYSAVWSPNFTGATVNSSRAILTFGVVGESSISSVAIDSSGNLRFTPITTISSAGRNLLIHVAAGHASWNADSSFVSFPSTSYRVTFMASVSTGTGTVGVRGNAADGYQESSLTTTPRQITYDWTQESAGTLQINSRNTPLNTEIIISNLRIHQAIGCYDIAPVCATCAQSPCVCPPPVCSTCNQSPCVCEIVTPPTTTSDPISTSGTSGSSVSETYDTSDTSGSGGSDNSNNSDSTEITSDGGTSSFHGSSDTTSFDSSATTSDGGSNSSISTATTSSGITETSGSTGTSGTGTSTSGTGTETSGTGTSGTSTSGTGTSGTGTSGTGTSGTGTSGTSGTSGSGTSATSATSVTSDTTATTSERIVVVGSGDIDGNGTVAIADALEILKYLAKMNSMVSESNQAAFQAALITPASQAAGKPAIADVLEILKHLAKMTSLVPKV